MVAAVEWRQRHGGSRGRAEVAAVLRRLVLQRDDEDIVIQ